MGRSQVLYNRTKGRNRNRSGRGGNRVDDAAATTPRNHGDAENRRNYPRGDQKQQRHHRYQQQPRPAPRGPIESEPKNYENEYELLFAGRDTYLGSSSSSSKNIPGVDNEEEKSLFVGGAASVCLPSMAAALEGLSVSQRLRVPLHAAATAFPSRFRKETPRDEEKEASNNSPSPATTAAADGASSVAAGAKSKDEDSSDALENCLDDACRTGDDAERSREMGGAAGGIRDPGGKTVGGNNNLSPAKAGQEPTSQIMEDADNFGGGGDDGDLDDWLDSVI